jgi:hypothetical protein
MHKIEKIQNLKALLGWSIEPDGRQQHREWE